MLESPIRVLINAVSFHPHPQRNAFRRGARQQSRWFFAIHSCDAAQAPTGFFEIVSDDFPVLWSN